MKREDFFYDCTSCGEDHQIHHTSPGGVETIRHRCTDPKAMEHFHFLGTTAAVPLHHCEWWSPRGGVDG